MEDVPNPNPFDMDLKERVKNIPFKSKHLKASEIAYMTTDLCEGKLLMQSKADEVITKIRKGDVDWDNAKVTIDYQGHPETLDMSLILDDDDTYWIIADGGDNLNRSRFIVNRVSDMPAEERTHLGLVLDADYHPAFRKDAKESWERHEGTGEIALPRASMIHVLKYRKVH